MGVLLWTVMANRPSLLWLLLIMGQNTGAAVQEESMCDAQILVRRHTVVQASPTKPLMLNCTLKYSGCDREPAVTWCKLLTDGSCVNINMSDTVRIGQEKVVEGKITSRLIINHVTKDDDGLYRCEILGSQDIVSHAINVSVSEESMCDAQILVRRHTVVQASPTKPLMLSCTLKYSGCNTPPTVTWCKLLTDGSCVNINMSDSMGIGREKVLEGKFTVHLIFNHVTKDDDGLYRCEISGSEEIVSHAINVSVTGIAVKPERPSVGNDSTGLHQNWLLYLVVSAVCLLVILTVILICVCTLGAGDDLKGRCLCIESLRGHYIA